MKYAKSIAAGVIGTLALVFLLVPCCAIIMIERVEVAVGSDECTGMTEPFRQSDFPPGEYKKEVHDGGNH